MKKTKVYVVLKDCFYFGDIVNWPTELEIWSAYRKSMSEKDYEPQAITIWNDAIKWLKSQLESKEPAEGESDDYKRGRMDEHYAWESALPLKPTPPQPVKSAEEYKITDIPNSQTITVPYNKKVWVNGIELPSGTYRYDPALKSSSFSASDMEDIKEIIRITDRKHPAWDRVKLLLNKKL